MKAIYPGSFDPITYGHMDIIKRANKMFDEVIVAVAADSPKLTLFTPQERADMIKRALSDFKNIKVDIFYGLVVDYAKKKNTRIILRGLRMISDFEYEFQMALTNRKLNPEVETIYLMPNESYSYISSKLIKEAASLGADLHEFIPEFIAEALKNKLQKPKAGGR